MKKNLLFLIVLFYLGLAQAQSDDREYYYDSDADRYYYYDDETGTSHYVDFDINGNVIEDGEVYEEEAYYDEEEEYVEPPYNTYHNNPISLAEVSRDHWKNITEGVDYTELSPEEQRKVEEEKKKAQANPSNNSNRNNNSRNYQRRGRSSGNGGSGGFMQGFLMFLLIIGICVVLYYVMQNMTEGGIDSRNRKTGKINVDISDIENDLENAELSGFIKSAQANQDYRVTVRLYYLRMVQLLSAKGFIKWKRDKTNRDYHREIKQKKLKSGFLNVTNIFERVWYGNMEFTKEDFESVQPMFNEFEQEVKKK